MQVILVMTITLWIQVIVQSHWWISYNWSCCIRFPIIICRGGFRGGDVVTCHPLFSDMTLQSQILVTESLLLTSVAKFIRKYLLSRHFSNMYSSCSNPATSLVKFSDNFFQEKLSVNESSITGTWFPCIVVK